MPLELARQQELPRDRELLLVQVAREPDDLHPVAQRRGDLAERVRRRDEQHLRQVVVDLEVVIVERLVLLRIEHLEERRRRIAAVVAPELVDLVEQDDGIHDFRAAHRLDDATRHRADVRATVAPDLGLVAHAAERHAHELPSHRARDRTPERCLADTGRSDETEDRTVEPLDERQHADVVEHAVLHVVETVMILIEHAARVRDVEDVIGALLPRQGDDPVEVGADNTRFGGDRRELPQPTQLLRASARESARGVPSPRSAAARSSPSSPSSLPELAMDRLELLLEVELALVLEQRAAHVVVDLSLELEQIDLARQHVRQRAQQRGQLIDGRADPAVGRDACRDAPRCRRPVVPASRRSG